MTTLTKPRKCEFNDKCPKIANYRNMNTDKWYCLEHINIVTRKEPK